MDKEKDILKLEKLVAALYLITNNLNDFEPVKWRLRDIGLSLLSYTDVPHYSLGHLSVSLGRLLSLIDLARLNPGVSQMNFDILKQEFLALREGINSNPDSHKMALLSNPISNSSHIEPKSRPLVSGRQETIYRLIKQQGPISIKDIAKAVPGVSGKTVQRELAALVKSGRLKREGDRRWSRYLAP